MTTDNNIDQKELHLSKTVNFWGNIGWQIQLQFTISLDKLIIKLTNQNEPNQEVTREFPSIFDLASFIRAFAEKNSITIFDRRISSLLFDLLQSGGSNITEDEVFQKIRKSAEVKTTKPLIKSSYKSPIDVSTYQFGSEENFGGSLKWKIKIGVSNGLQKPMIIEFHDVQENDIIQHNVANIYEAVSIMKEKIKALNVQLFERRLARWLSDYFEMYFNIPLTFTKALKIIREKETFSSLKEEIITAKEKRLNLENISSLIPGQDPEVKARIKSLTLKEAIDENKIISMLRDLIDSNKDEENITITRNIVFQTENGEEIKIEDQDLNTSPAKQPGKRYATSVFDNPLEEKITNIELSDILPYDLKLDDIEISTTADITKEFLDAGMKLTFSIKELMPKEKVSIDYIISRRINRTIILQKNQSIDIINTNIPISLTKPEVLYKYEGYTRFITIISDFDNIQVNDFIPTEFEVYKTIIDPPEYRPFTKKLENGTEIEWIHQKVPQGKIFSYSYEFFPRPFVSLYKGKTMINDNSECNFVLLYQPLAGTHNSIITIVTENESNERIQLQFDITLPTGATIRSVNLSKNSVSEFFWEIVPPPISEDQILSLNIWIEKYQRNTFSFYVSFEKKPFNFLSPIKVTFNEVENYHIPQFTYRVTQYLPLPTEHVELLNQMMRKT